MTHRYYRNLCLGRLWRGAMQLVAPCWIAPPAIEVQHLPCGCPFPTSVRIFGSLEGRSSLGALAISYCREPPSSR